MRGAVMRGPPEPETNKAALQGRLVRKTEYNTAEHTGRSENFKPLCLVAKFGLAFQTAVVAALAWGVAR